MKYKMDFLFRLFQCNINWCSKKVFFDNIKDKLLIRLLVFKGIVIVNSRDAADIVIVRHHQSCWWSWKELSLSDLYYILSDADKYLYYIWRFKHQYRPKSPTEKCFFIHNYMVIIDFSRKVFNVYCNDHAPFIDQKVYTKHIIKDKSYLKVWIGDYTRLRTTNHGDSLLIHICEDKCMIIRDAICEFRNVELLNENPSTPFIVGSKSSLSKLFHRNNVLCRVIHQQY